MLSSGRVMEYTYSTPGTSRSRRSMGTVARCCTSAAEAPGICTNTSSMGTTIWGSSSRGVIRIAKAPASSAPAMNSGVSFELMKARAISPAIRSGVFPSAAIVISLRFAYRSSRARPVAPRCAHCSPGRRGPHNIVFGAVEGPNREALQGCFSFGGGIAKFGKEHMEHLAAAANRRHRGKLLRMHHREVPGAKATHAQAGQIDPLGIDFVTGADFVEQLKQDLIRPGFPGRALRRYQYEGELRMLGDVFGRAVNIHLPDIGPALPRAMQE